MATFTYKAIKKGETESYIGKIEASDRFEVYNAVRKDGAQVVSVEETSAKKMEAINNFVINIQRVGANDKILLTRNLGSMLKAGLSLTRSLSVIKRQSRNPKLKEVLTAISDDIEKGSSLSSAMEKYPKIFPNLVTSMIAAGEESGTLSETLLTISNQLKNAHDLKKKVKGAMIYPTVIIFVLIFIGAAMMIFVVPSLTATFTTMEIELPMSTQVIIAISDFLVAHTVISFVAFIGFIGFIFGGLKTAKGRRVFETVFLHVPILGQMMKETNSARTGRTLSSLLSSGVNMLASIDITKKVIQNSYYKEVLTLAQSEVEKGKSLADVFRNAEHLYPPIVGELVAVGEETGALPDMFQEIATYYEEEIDQKTKNMSTIIEPFLMLIVGGAVGFFALAMISPIYSMTSNFA